MKTNSKMPMKPKKGKEHDDYKEDKTLIKKMVKKSALRGRK